MRAVRRLREGGDQPGKDAFERLARLRGAQRRIIAAAPPFDDPRRAGGMIEPGLGELGLEAFAARGQPRLGTVAERIVDVADPLGGSYVVERATDEIEALAEEMFAHIDSMGGGSMLEGVLAGIESGWFQQLIAEAAPGHVETVRETVLDVLTPEQLEQLYAIAGAVLTRLDPDTRLTATSCQFSEGPILAHAG